jgi:hypothetical protein
MAKTFIDFVPSQIQAPQYNVTLDDNTYTMIVTWSLFAQRYYITLVSLSGAVILTEALVGSPIGIEITGIAWANGKVVVTTDSPHGLSIGSAVNLTITGAAPDALNGVVQALVIDRITFSYPLAADPGAASVLGSVEKNINLVGGFFESTLIYRAANAQFEVSP